MLKTICYCDKCGIKIETDEVYDIGVGAYDRMPTSEDDYGDCIEGQGFHLCVDCAKNILAVIHSNIMNTQNKKIKKDNCSSCCGSKVSNKVWDEFYYPHPLDGEVDLPFENKVTTQPISQPTTTNIVADNTTNKEFVEESLDKTLNNFKKALSKFENIDTSNIQTTSNASTNDMNNIVKEIWKKFLNK